MPRIWPLICQKQFIHVTKYESSADAKVRKTSGDQIYQSEQYKHIVSKLYFLKNLGNILIVIWLNITLSVFNLCGANSANSGQRQMKSEKFTVL